MRHKTCRNWTNCSDPPWRLQTQIHRFKHQHAPLGPQVPHRTTASSLRDHDQASFRSATL